MNLPSENEKYEIAEQLLGISLDPLKPISLFTTYFNYYESIICPSFTKDTVVDIVTPVLQGHSDVLSYARLLCEKNTSSRDEIVAEWFPNRTSTAAEREHISRSIVNVAFMIDCNERDYYPEGYHENGQRAKWDGSQSFLHFLEKSFPYEKDDTDVTLGGKTSLKAWKLSKRYGISIRGTDNLLEHLAYNPREQTLTVFHHVEYLRSNLRRSRDASLEDGFANSLKLYAIHSILHLCPY